jgi:hypothetical protein
MVGLLAAMALPNLKFRIPEQAVVIDEFLAAAISGRDHSLVAPLRQGRTSGRGTDTGP